MSKNNRVVPAGGALLALAMALLATGPLSAGEDDTKAEKAITAMGGKVVRDDTAKGKPIVKVEFLLPRGQKNTQVTDVGLTRVLHFPHCSGGQ
jgi:hypothetical protein